MVNVTDKGPRSQPLGLALRVPLDAIGSVLRGFFNGFATFGGPFAALDQIL